MDINDPLHLTPLKEELHQSVVPTAELIILVNFILLNSDRRGTEYLVARALDRRCGLGILGSVGGRAEGEN